MVSQALLWCPEVGAPRADVPNPESRIRVVAAKNMLPKNKNKHVQKPTSARRFRLFPIAAIAASALVVGVGVPMVAAEATTSTSSASVTPTAETWSTVRHPDTPQYRQGYLSATNSADQTYLKFDVSKVAAGKKIVSASLSLSVRSTQATSGGVQVFPSSNAWSASTLTSANRPAHQLTLLNTATVRAVTGTTISVPLTPSAVSTQQATSFELRYSQKYVGTLFSLRPTLHLVLAPTSTPSVAPTTAPTSSTTPTASAAPVTPTPTASLAPAPAPTATTSTAAAVAPASDRKVFAHYFPPYPISLDNLDASVDYYTRNYLSPAGEGGKYAAVGGLLRDRPLPRAPLTDDWRVKDLTTEVDQAADAGIDGFTVDIMSLSGSNWTTTTDLMQAAAASGRDFVVVPNLDVTASAGTATPSQVAASLAQLFASPAAYRLADGRYALSSFKAEGETVSWWSQVLSTLKNTYHDSVALTSVFLNASDTNMKAYAPISYAEGIWGQRTPTTVAQMPDYAAKAHALGLKWMAPVAVQDVRPRSALYAESDNTETLRATWQQAIDDGADMVQLVTWNDYSEGTSFAPSVAHGNAFLDASSYYATWFKTGSAPEIRTDQMIVTHRIQFFSAVPQTGTVLMQPTLDGTSTPPRNTVEVLTMLTAPATVTVNIGGHKYSADAPAGVHAMTFPLELGAISAWATRGSSTILTATSWHQVVAYPKVQDLQYYAVEGSH